MGLAKEVLDSIGVEDTEGKSRLLVVLLRIFKSMGLLLDFLKLREEVFGRIFNARLPVFFLAHLLVLLDQVCENRMINR